MDTSTWAVSVPVGDRFHGWEIIRPVATGSWGSVYEGRRGGDRAALKFLPTGSLTPRQLKHLSAMTDRELRSHGELGAHPRLIALVETFVVAEPGSAELDGATVIVTELAERSLADLLRAGRPVPDAPRLIVQICEGLSYMHAEGRLHGDLKPSNILVAADGSVRLADFGMAAALDGSHAYLPRAGSMDYLAPERRDEPMTVRGAAVRRSADIWALGVTACELLCGHHPFTGATWRSRAAAAMAYVEGRAPLVLDPVIPPGWRDWISDCLAPTHGERSRHDAASLLERARALADGDRGRRFAGYRWRRPGGMPRRRRLAAAITAVAALSAGGSAVAQATGEHRDPTARWLRSGSDIPRQYRKTIVQAGTVYCDSQLVSPVLIAAMLKAESGFDPNLADPAKDEYGIARWTPRVLKYYLPQEQLGTMPKPPLDPYESIRAMGRFLCRWAPDLIAANVPGDRQLNLAAAYRSSVTSVVKAGGVAPKWRQYTANVATYMKDYQPR